MKDLLAKSHGPVRDLLDEFARMSEGRRMVIAGGLAVLVHAAVFFGGGLLLLSVRNPHEPKPLEKKSQLEVTLFTPTPDPHLGKAASTPAPKPEPLAPKEEEALQKLFQAMPEELRREFIDVDGLAQKKNLSKRALLESWADSIAGSRLPGKDDGPLPTQDGKALPFVEFKNQQASVGKPFIDPSMAPPIFQPQPVTKDDLSQSPKNKVIPKVAEVAKTTQAEKIFAPTPPPSRLALAHATPPPSVRKVREASADEIPLFLSKPETQSPSEVKLRPETTPEPIIKPTPPPTATPAPNGIVARLSNSQAPQPVQSPGYAPQQVQTQIRGGNAQPGDNGVDAVATAAGKYKKNVKITVGSRWTYLKNNSKLNSLLVIGQTTVDVALDSRGKILRCKVTDNTSNAAHAQICERAFLESQKDIDPPPPELLVNGVFEDSYTFTLY